MSHDEKITCEELAEALKELAVRTGNGNSYFPELARNIFEHITAHREPEWEYGEVYRSADGRPYRFIADGEWLDCASGQKVYLPGSPPGPLVKLVPEGSEAAVTPGNVDADQAWKDGHGKGVEHARDLARVQEHGRAYQDGYEQCRADMVGTQARKPARNEVINAIAATGDHSEVSPAQLADRIMKLLDGTE